MGTEEEALAVYCRKAARMLKAQDRYDFWNGGGILVSAAGLEHVHLPLSPNLHRTRRATEKADRGRSQGRSLQSTRVRKAR